MRKKRNAYFREYHSKKMKEDSNYREQRKRSWDKWRMSNPEKKKRFQKNWLDKNPNYFKKPGKGYAIKKATAIKRRMNGGIVDPKIIEELFLREKLCKFCKTTEKLSIDHIIPISKGGDSSKNNLQILCMKCNIKKGSRILNIT